MTIPNKFNNGELADAPLVNENFDYLDTLTEDIAKNVKLLSDTSTFTKYDETKTYAKDDIVTVLSPDGRIVAYISLKNQNNGNALSDENWWKKTDLGGGNMPVGTIFAHSASATFVPENSLPCDGTEYAQAQFKTLYNDWLVGKKLETCTYEEYQQEVAVNGACAKFALDTSRKTFKVPLIPDGYYVKAGKGTANKAGLPNIEGEMLGGGKFGDDPTYFKGAFSRIGNGPSKTFGARDGENCSNLASFNASRSNPIYGKSDTVETDAVAYSYFVVVATGSIKQSEMDWSQWASGLQGKANTDLANTAPKLADSFIAKLVPDYTAGITKSKSFTAEIDCLMYVRYYWQTQYGGSSNLNCSINGVNIELPVGTNGNKAVANSSVLPLKKSDIVLITPESGVFLDKVIIYPLKGAN